MVVVVHESALVRYYFRTFSMQILSKMKSTRKRKEENSSAGGWFQRKQPQKNMRAVIEIVE